MLRKQTGIDLQGKLVQLFCARGDKRIAFCFLLCRGRKLSTVVEIRRVWEGKGRKLYGAEKVWKELRREGVDRVLRAGCLAALTEETGGTTW